MSTTTHTSSLITKAKKFNPDKVKFLKPLPNTRGGKSVALRYNGNKLTLQVPLMLTWGANVWEKQ